MNENDFQISHKIKIFRKNKNITLNELSKKCGISKSYLSRIENGKQVNLSISTIKRILQAMDLYIFNLFVDEIDKVYIKKDLVDIVRKNNRKTIKYGGLRWKFEQLAQINNKKIEFIITYAEPGQVSGQMPFQHEGEECGIILEGTLKFIVNEKEYILNEGDSIYLYSSQPHKWIALGDKTTITIWAITPPSF
jgi:transcriptional regulator with XRE-family HTH domain